MKLRQWFFQLVILLYFAVNSIYVKNKAVITARKFKRSITKINNLIFWE